MDGWVKGNTGLTIEDVRKRLGLNIPPEEMDRYRERMTFVRRFPRGYAVPENADWSPWATPVKDQGACGSCVAFGVTGAIEGQIAVQHDEDTDLSEAFLFFCGCGLCCNRGWQPGPALDFCMEYGLPDELCFPYQAVDQPCAPGQIDSAWSPVDWQELFDDAERKQWIAENGPVVAAMQVYADFAEYVGGVYRHESGQLLGGHCIAVFGYDADGWLCKNSWGEAWGERGWFRIAYGECGLDDLYPFWTVGNMAQITPAPPPQPPGCDPFKRLRGRCC